MSGSKQFFQLMAAKLKQLFIKQKTVVNATERTQWTIPRCGRHQPATNNDVRDGRFI